MKTLHLELIQVLPGFGVRPRSARQSSPSAVRNACRLARSSQTQSGDSAASVTAVQDAAATTGRGPANYSWLSYGIILLHCFACSLAAAEPTVIELWPEGVPDLRADASEERDLGGGTFLNIHKPTLVVYPPSTNQGADTAVVFCAGGGYERVAVGANGGGVTRWLNSIGVTVFVLKYRNKEYGHPAPLRDVLRAVRIVRSRAKEFGVNPEHIGVMGGSAGGHLSACAGTLYDAPEGRTGAALDQVSARPDFIVLIFPVITMLDPSAHAPSRRNLLGTEPTEELKRHLSAELQVTKNTSPTFLIHSTEDRTVPVENSLLFFQAMRKAGAPIEMHLYPRGPHGSGMSPSLGPTAEWPRLCELWMRFNGWLPPGTANR